MSGSLPDLTKPDGAAIGDAAPAWIWIVRGHYHTNNSRGWLPFEADPKTEYPPPLMLEAMGSTQSGHFLPADRFPADNHPRRNDAAHKQRIPQIFSSGFFFVRKESADVLRQFDLGQGALYPTRLWRPDKVTPVPCEVFFLSQGNQKNAFLLEHSPQARRLSGGGQWWLPPNPVDDQLFFSADALEGPDIWWDPKIYMYFFISDRLAKALKQAKLARDWMLLRCPVMDARDGASASGGSAA